MLFKKEDYAGRPTESLTIKDIVEATVRNAPDYYDGELESVASRVTVLTSFVAQMAADLPPDAQKRLAAHFLYYPVEQGGEHGNQQHMG